MVLEKRAETISLSLSITKIVSLFCNRRCLCTSWALFFFFFFMLLFTRGSFGTLWRTDKKFIIKTKAFETGESGCCRNNPLLRLAGPNPGQILLKALERSEERGSNVKYLSSEIIHTLFVACDHLIVLAYSISGPAGPNVCHPSEVEPASGVFLSLSNYHSDSHRPPPPHPPPAPWCHCF